MTSYYHTYKIIASILSYKSDTFLLKECLSEPTFDWIPIVKLGSAHLVLPAIYLRLEEKSLLNVLPPDLKAYLEEITHINRNRNTSILKDVYDISALFQSHNIHHVFLKGAALIAADYYRDIGERMIGDIDILVSEDQLETANSLLISKNYKPMEQTLGNTYFEHKHLPRLVLANSLAAIEIHRRLFHAKTTYLRAKDVLQSKKKINNIFIPSSLHLLEHSILNWQINDHGNYLSRLGLRSAYDTLTILETHSEIKIKNEVNSSYSKNYFLILSLFFNDIDSDVFNKNGLKLSYLKFKFKHQKFSNIVDKVLYKLKYFKTLFNRLLLFVGNKNYRKDVIKDQNRILKLLKNLRR